MHCYRLLFLIIILLTAGFSIYEKSRILDRTETELAFTFNDAPDVLLRNSYGGLEEGGDVALLKIGDKDCAEIRNKFVAPWPLRSNTQEYDTFRQINLTPSTLYFRHWTDNAGADTIYLLDKATCVLYRQAHFE